MLTSKEQIEAAEFDVKNLNDKIEELKKDPAQLEASKNFDSEREIYHAARNRWGRVKEDFHKSSVKHQAKITPLKKKRDRILSEIAKAEIILSH
jgi:hypothetical protein